MTGYGFFPLGWDSLLLPKKLLEDRFVLGPRGAGGLLLQYVLWVPWPGHKGMAAWPGHGWRLLPDVQCNRIAAPSLHRLLGHSHWGDLLVSGCKRQHSGRKKRVPADVASPTEPSPGGRMQLGAQGSWTGWVLEEHSTCPWVSVGMGQWCHLLALRVKPRPYLR